MDLDKINPLVLVVTHKEDVLIDDHMFKPIMVNHDVAMPNHWLKDNTGDHISFKNKSFCELTAMYWAWKNISDDHTHIGLFHYRRGMCLKSRFDNFFRTKYYADSKEDVTRYIDKKSLWNLAVENIVCLPKKEGVKGSIAEHYRNRHHSMDWNILLDVMSEKVVNFSDAKMFFDNSNQARWGNMFFMPKDVFDEYCTWLFDILFELEKRVEVSHDNYQSRVFGFISERLLTLYFDHLKKYKIKNLPYVFYKF